MTGPPVLLSGRLDEFRYAGRVAPGVEVKLDREDADELGAEYTLTDACVERGLDPDDIVSVHLPPGTIDRYGMSVAAGTVGTIVDFTHTAFGDAVNPQWLTLHSDRRFDYRTQVDRLGTITELTGYPVALENPPDRGYLYPLEGLALFGFLAEQVDGLADVSLVVDTFHLPSERGTTAVEAEAIDRVLDWMDGELRERAAAPFNRFVEERMAGADLDVPPDTPWAPAITALSLAGGEQVRAVHLNDPVRDGVPDLENGASDGLLEFVAACQVHDVAIVLEPEETESEEVEAAIRWLEEQVR